MAGLQSPAIEESFEQVDGFLDQLRIVSDDPESRVDLGYDYQFNPLNPVRKVSACHFSGSNSWKLFLGTTPDDLTCQGRCG